MIGPAGSQATLLVTQVVLSSRVQRITNKEGWVIGIPGASRYEAFLQGQLERSTVSTRYGDVPVLTVSVGNRTVVYIRLFGWENNMASGDRQ